MELELIEEALSCSSSRSVWGEVDKEFKAGKSEGERRSGKGTEEE